MSGCFTENLHGIRKKYDNMRNKRYLLEKSIKLLQVYFINNLGVAEIF